MFQFAFDAVLFRLTYQAPQFVPLLELPPQIERGRTGSLIIYKNKVK